MMIVQQFAQMYKSILSTSYGPGKLAWIRSIISRSFLQIEVNETSVESMSWLNKYIPVKQWGRINHQALTSMAFTLVL